jgi:hypothetical protein
VLTTLTNARRFTQAGVTAPAQLDKRREAAVTALGVLVPGEVIAAATAVAGLLAQKTGAAPEWLHLGLARLLMLTLGIVGIPTLFRIGTGGWWKNGWRGVGLLLLTLVSFAGWLALQPLSIYQGWFSADAGELAAVGLVGGLVVGGLAGMLGWSQAATSPLLEAADQTNHQLPVRVGPGVAINGASSRGAAHALR